MTRHVLLNNIDHKDLKVITTPSARFGDNVSAVVAVPTEFGDLQKEYPILLYKTPDQGEFQAVALLGLQKDENLFLGQDGWRGHYVPALLAKGPFSIGFQEQELDGELVREPVVHVDMDDSRINKEEGEALFMPHGGNAPYLERLSGLLKAIGQGLSYGKAMFEMFDEMALIEPVSIEVTLNENQAVNLTNYYTINEDRLKSLKGGQLEQLNASGFLQGAYLMVASLTNIERLIELKNRKQLEAQNQ